jgi:RNA polymerase sigma factor (sigma-70 family)
VTVTPHPTPPLWTTAQRARLVRLCAAVVGPAAAEDVAQEALLEAWRHRERLVEPAGADAWLGAIARNVCRRWLRAQGADRSVPAAAVPEQEVGLDDVLEREDVVDLLGRALGRLPAATAAALVGHYVDELSHAEIAADLGTTADAVSMRVSRGRARLRHLLETEYADDAADWTHPDAGWRTTRLPCADCGRPGMEMRRDDSEVAFRCRRCDAGGLSSRLALGAPAFAALVGDLRRPTALQSRLAAWTHSYWAQDVPRCVRCDRAVTARTYARDTAGPWPVRHGWLVECPACHEVVSSSVAGAVLALPEVRAARRRDPSLRTLPVRDVVRDGQQAKVVALGTADGMPRVGVVVLEQTLRVVHVDAPANG